jgi:hypothetical protein
MLKHYPSISHTYDNEHFPFDFLSRDTSAFGQNVSQGQIINSLFPEDTLKYMQHI